MGLILGSRPDIGAAQQVAVTFAALAVSIVVASLSRSILKDLSAKSG
jgi:hypothetical protein